MTMGKSTEQRRCHMCGQRTLRREKRPYEYAVSHDGRPPVTIHIPDLDVIVCTNPDCRPEHPDDAIIVDDAASWRITQETYRQLGLLTPTEIRAARARLGLTQQELQQLVGLGGNSLSRWENGRVYQARSMDTLLRIVFNVAAAREYVGAARNGMATNEERRFRHQYLDAATCATPEVRKRSRFNPKTFWQPSKVA